MDISVCKYPEMVRGYLCAALFSEGLSETMLERFTPDAVAQADRDTRAFLKDIDTYISVDGTPWEAGLYRTGWDFYMSRNFRGAGFVDRLPDHSVAEDLYEVSRSFGQCLVFLDLDGEPLDSELDMWPLPDDWHLRNLEINLC